MDAPGDFEKTPRSATSDAKLFCERCWRLEYHFNNHRATNPASYYIWCILTLGGLYLVGPYRCRCCGDIRFWRFDLEDAQKTRLRSVRKAPRKHTSNYEPFRKSFSIRSSVRAVRRALTRPFRRRRRRGRRR